MGKIIALSQILKSSTLHVMHKYLLLIFQNFISKKLPNIIKITSFHPSDRVRFGASIISVMSLGVTSVLAVPSGTLLVGWHCGVRNHQNR